MKNEKNALYELRKILSSGTLKHAAFGDDAPFTEFILSAAKVRFGEFFSSYFVLHVGHSQEERVRFDNFLDRFYDSGYGEKIIWGTLWLSASGKECWATRSGYDGAEWWEVHLYPQPPTKGEK